MPRFLGMARAVWLVLALVQTPFAYAEEPHIPMLQSWGALDDDAIGCLGTDAARLITEALISNDKEAVNLALRGRCKVLKAGTEVWVQGFSADKRLLLVRPKGELETYLIPSGYPFRH